MEKITSAEYAKFLEHYAWMLLKAPDYRLGQAFLNYFPDISKNIRRDGDLGTIDEMNLFYETNVSEAQKFIDRYRELD